MKIEWKIKFYIYLPNMQNSLNIEHFLK
jgi:hypothetical protein